MPTFDPAQGDPSGGYFSMFNNMMGEVMTPAQLNYNPMGGTAGLGINSLFDSASSAYQNALEVIKKMNSNTTTNTSSGTTNTTNTTGGAPSTQSVAATNNPEAKKLAQAAEQEANAMGGTTSQGKCYTGTTNAVKKALGIQLTGISAYMAADQLEKNAKFTLMPAGTQLCEGDIVVYGPKKDASVKNGQHGHIETILANGKGASDYIGNVNADTYQWVKVFRLKGGDSSNIA